MSGVLNLLLAGAASAIKDAYFNLTTLLLNTSSTNGAQNNTFLDSSTNNFTITRNGNTTQGTFTPFSQTGWSNYLNGSTDYLSVADNAAWYFTGDFTVEAWVYLTAYPSVAGTLLAQWVDSGGTDRNFSLTVTPTGMPDFAMNRSATSYSVTGATAIPLNTWTHVAGVLNGTSLKLYVNGTSVGTPATVAGSANNSTAPLGIGAYGNGSFKISGYISNARVVSGSAVYTANFTPSTTPLTAITNTSLLTCQSNRFLDTSTNAFAITANGTPSVQAFSPFLPTAAYDTSVVGGSGYFDGSGDYLSIASNAAFTFTGDFTWEGWFYMTANPSQSYSTRLIDYNGGSNFLVFSTSDGTDYLGFAVAGTTYTTTTALPRRQWAHVAVSRSGTGSNNLKLFLNGTAISTQTNTSTVTAANIYISNRPSGDGYFTGYIGSYRMTNTGLYTTTFTPATSPFTAVTGTALLLNYTNAGIFDSTAKNVLETVGNAQVSTTQAKWGTAALYLDGNGDYLRRPSSQLFVFNGDFTIEFWAWKSASGLNNYDTPVSCSSDGNATNGWILELGTVSYLRFLTPSVTVTSSTINPNDSTWHHYAVARSGSSIKLFRDGTEIGSGTYSGAIGNSSIPELKVGAYGDASTNSFNGYIDDLRITNGYARYTTTFTPPTAAFAIQ